MWCSISAGALALVTFCLTGPVQASMVYVSNEKGNSITVIDSDTQTVKQTVEVGRRPRGITISNDGKFLYLCASDEDGVEVIDTATMKVVRTLQSGPDPELFILHPSGNPLYIANEDDAEVTVLDVNQNKILAQVPVGWGSAPTASSW
jgi:YVTN family beta-propeller protein